MVVWRVPQTAIANAHKYGPSIATAMQRITQSAITTLQQQRIGGNAHSDG